MQEKWCEIKEFSSYDVSSCGRVFSFKTKRFLRPETTKDGYQRVVLSKKGRVKKCYIHRLVAQHFIDSFQDYLEVNHRDGNKTNNYLENLECVTRSENENHSIKTLGKKGKIKISLEVKNQILTLLSKGFSTYAIAEKFNIARSTVSGIKNR
jgi:translation initiation factor 2 beta subunit (eIF-2beta)/eIF-5